VVSRKVAGLYQYSSEPVEVATIEVENHPFCACNPGSSTFCEASVSNFCGLSPHDADGSISSETDWDACHALTSSDARGTTLYTLWTPGGDLTYESGKKYCKYAPVALTEPADITVLMQRTDAGGFIMDENTVTDMSPLTSCVFDALPEATIKWSYLNEEGTTVDIENQAAFPDAWLPGPNGGGVHGEGTYACTGTNDLGSTELTATVTWEYPVVLTVEPEETEPIVVAWMRRSLAKRMANPRRLTNGSSTTRSLTMKPVPC
jgi:hypothetical protein